MYINIGDGAFGNKQEKNNIKKRGKIMNQIEAINIPRLRTDESLGFLGQVLAQTSMLTLEADQSFVQQFGDAVKSFEMALKPTLTNSYTESRADIFERTTHVCIGLRKYSESLTFHPEESIKQVAKKVYAIIDKYGLFSQMSYKELYPNLQAMLLELGAIEDDIATLWMQSWVNSLDKLCTDFMTITEEKIAEDTQKEVGIVQESRGVAEEAYKALINRVNAGASYNGVEPYQNFIDMVTVIINEYKQMLSARQTRNNNKNKEDSECVNDNS